MAEPDLEIVKVTGPQSMTPPVQRLLEGIEQVREEIERCPRLKRKKGVVNGIPDPG